MDRYDIRIGKEFINSKGKKRIVFDVQKCYTTSRTRVLYTNTTNGYEIVKSCYIEQFVKWINS